MQGGLVGGSVALSTPAYAPGWKLCSFGGKGCVALAPQVCAALGHELQERFF